MKADSPLWRVMGPPAQADEARALDKVRDLIPDDGVARAWVNVTFTSSDGNLNEVDVLLLTKGGLWILELKGWHGTIHGTQTTWTQNGKNYSNPRLLANSKAKKLASILKDLAQKAKLPKDTVPFVGEAVVLHGDDSQVQLDAFGAEGVWRLDGYRVKGLGPASALSDFLAAAPKRASIDGVQAKAIDNLMQAAGLMPRAKQRVIGHYTLDDADPLGEGHGWQDFLVSHPQAKTKHRIRVFPYPKGADRATREAVDARALREFRLTFGVNHSGIIGPSELINPDEGPALVFPHDSDEVALDEYLEAKGDSLTFDDRDRLVQQLGEIVKFAHGQRLVHRALSPWSVRATTNSQGAVELRIRDWDAARRTDQGTSTATFISRGVTDVVGVVGEASALYLAPETLRNVTSGSPMGLDVYGVGAVAYRILTGKAPAANILALQDLIGSKATGLDPRAVVPELADQYAQVILEATAFNDLERLVDIGDLLVSLDAARESARGDEKQAMHGDPLDASVGDIVGDRFEIRARRGSGSTGVALEVDDYATEAERVILKLAKDDAAAARLTAEAAILGRLDHPRVVRRLDGPLTVGTRQGLLLSDAGTETLADRIRVEGKGTIEQLEQWASDLFEAAAYLEGEGVFHRDIKPSNLAVKPDPANRKPRLTLFDFSLSDEPLANIRSGSRAYLDPYLGTAGRAQYDSAAERFAIAATLFEFATQETIWWEGGEAPASPQDAPIVQRTMFDERIADGLVTFFTTALAPDAKNRHPTLDAMRLAWQAAIAGAREDAEDAEANDAKALAARLDTPLTDAGLSARALSALDRIAVSTVEELLGVRPMQINQLHGLGVQARREIQIRIRDWRHRLRPTETQSEEPIAGGRRPLESIQSVLTGPEGESPEAKFRRLQKQSALRDPLDDLARWVGELGGVATRDEMATRFLRDYGSTLDGEKRWAAATEIVDAVLDFDGRTSDPRLLFRATRDRSRTAIAVGMDDAVDSEETDRALEVALHLGEAVDDLLRDADVVSPAILRETLRAVESGGVRFPDARLIQLAVGLSRHGKLSSMSEAYRADLAPARAVEIALRGAASRELAVTTIEQRVRGRFPDAATIPQRPALDDSVKKAMPYLEWRDDGQVYALRAADAASLTFTASSTTWGRAASDPAIAARLAASINDRGALTLVASRKRPLAETADRLAAEYRLQVVDLADLVLDVLKSAAAKNKVAWQVVIRADAAAAAARDRQNLQTLARAAFTPRWREFLASPEPAILLNPAVVARLGLVDLIAEVTDLSTPRAAARWFLLPRPRSGGTPDLDGVPMPFGADRWLEISTEFDDAVSSGPSRPLKGDAA
jgi:serine/threonine protein kinase